MIQIVILFSSLEKYAYLLFHNNISIKVYRGSASLSFKWEKSKKEGIKEGMNLYLVVIMISHLDIKFQGALYLWRHNILEGGRIYFAQGSRTFIS